MFSTYLSRGLFKPRLIFARIIYTYIYMEVLLDVRCSCRSFLYPVSWDQSNKEVHISACYKITCFEQILLSRFFEQILLPIRQKLQMDFLLTTIVKPRLHGTEIAWSRHGIRSISLPLFYDKLLLCSIIIL